MRSGPRRHFNAPGGRRRHNAPSVMAFRHAFRVSELVDIRWQQIDLDTATVQIRLAKNGTLSIHGLQGDELRAVAGAAARAS